MAKVLEFHNYLHDNQIIHEKVIYFADHIQYANALMGKISALQLENHKSLLEKIIFQIDHNLKKCIPYIETYLKNPLITAKDDYLFDKFFNNEKKGINQFSHLKLGNHTRRDDILFEIKKESQELLQAIGENILQYYVTDLRTLIEDENIRLSEPAKKKIRYYAHLIVTEYIFQGFDQEDIQHLIKRVVSGKIEDNYPQRIKPIPESKNFFDRLVQYPFTEKMELRYIARIENIEASPDTDKQYKDLRILHPQGEILKGLFADNFYQGLKEEQIFNQNQSFLKEKTLIVLFELSTNSYLEGKRIFFDELESLVNYVNGLYKATAYVDYSQVCVLNLKNNSGVLNWTRTDYMAKMNDDFEKYSLFANQNNYNNLKKTKAGEKILQTENLFLRTLISKDSREKITAYWRYLESLFDYEAGNKAIEIRKKISSILLNDEEDSFKIELGLLLQNSLNNNGFRVGQDINPITFKKYFGGIGKLIDVDKLSDHEDVLKRPFLKELIHTHQNFKNNLNKHLEAARNYYGEILWEAYAQRNFLQHNAIVFDKSVLKLAPILQLLVVRFRRILLKMLLSSEKSFETIEELIQFLSEKGNCQLKKVQSEDLQIYADEFRETIGLMTNKNLAQNIYYQIDEKTGVCIYVHYVDKKDFIAEIQSNPIDLVELAWNNEHWDENRLKKEIEDNDEKIIFFDTKPEGYYLIQNHFLIHWTKEQATLDAKKIIDKSLQFLFNR